MSASAFSAEALPQLTYRRGWEHVVDTERIADWSLAVAHTKPKAPRGTLLLLHGFPTNSWDWYKIWPTLGGDYELIAADFLGFGLSDKPLGHAYSIMEQADLVETLLDQREVGPCHILAHDYGDSVAQELLARDKDREKRRYLSATLLNGGIIPGAHRPRRIQRLLASPLGPMLQSLLSRERFKGAFSEVFGEKTKPVDAELNTMWEFITHNTGLKVQSALLAYMAERKEHGRRWIDALLHADVPLLLVNGSDDPVSGKHVIDAYRDLGGPGEIVELAGIGHYPQLEAPDAVVKALSDFLKRNAPL